MVSLGAMPWSASALAEGGQEAEEAVGKMMKETDPETERYGGRGSGHETEEHEDSETEEAETRAAVMRTVNHSRGRLALPGQRLPAEVV